MKKWAPRLVWLPLYFLILAVIPDVDRTAIAPVLRKKAVQEGLFKSWSSTLQDELNPTASFGQVMRSFVEGEEALPKPPDVSFAVPLAAVIDRSGAPKAWTLDDVIAESKHDYLTFFAAKDGWTLIVESATPDETTSALVARVESNGVPVESDAIARRLGATAAELNAIRTVDGAPAGDEVSALKFDNRAETPYPTRWAVIPPLTAIFAALILRRALLSLILGVWAGAIVIVGVNWNLGLGQAFHLYEEKLTSAYNLSIVAFVLFLVGMIGTITRSGGTQGLVNLMVNRSKGARSSRIVTALMGLIVFFDDYSNTVIVGSSMRPVTDRFRVAREKLAYLIDSTAAPVAGIALFSTWIGYEVSQYQAALDVIGVESPKGYGLFLDTIPFRYYCIFTLFFVFANVLMSRDFGPMLRAEKRAARTGKLIRDGAVPLTGKAMSNLAISDKAQPRARLAVVPIVFVILFMAVGFLFVGGIIPKWDLLQSEYRIGQLIGDVLNNDYIMTVAVIAAVMGSLLSVVMAIKVIGLGDALKAWGVGFTGLLLAVGVLASAWALALSCEKLGADLYFLGILGDSMPLWVQPVAFFGLACVVAFATGTSWGTMAILLPITIPLVYESSAAAGGEPFGIVTLLAFGAVLEGAIFGDHCSPISDTTVLSSVSAGSDHLDHVKTQIPYALTTMLIAITVGYIPVALGWYGPGVAIGAGAVACALVVRFVGRPIPDAPNTDEPKASEAAA